MLTHVLRWLEAVLCILFGEKLLGVLGRDRRPDLGLAFAGLRGLRGSILDRLSNL